MPGRAVRSCISACIPFFALLAVAALDAMLLLQSSGDVTPLAQKTALKDVFQQAVLLGGPRTLLHYMNEYRRARPIKNNITPSATNAANAITRPPINGWPRR